MSCSTCEKCGECIHIDSYEGTTDVDCMEEGCPMMADDEMLDSIVPVDVFMQGYGVIEDGDEGDG